MKIWGKVNHAGMALFVFTILTGAILWRTGSLRLRVGAEAPQEVSSDAGGHSADDGHGHGAAKEDEHAGCSQEEGVDWCAGHKVPESACTRCNAALVPAFQAKGDWCQEHKVPESQCVACNPSLKAKAAAAPAKAPADLAELAQRTCEHKLRMIDCKDCRFELGVVKVEPGLAQSLLTTQKAEVRELVQVLHLTGAVHLDATRVTDVSPPTAGRLARVNVRLGEAVKQGDVIAVLHSGEFGEAKAAYLDAHAKLEIARKEEERQRAVVAGLEKLVERLLANQESTPPAKGMPAVGREPLGEAKGKLLAAAARVRLARSVHQREKGLLEKQASSKAEFEQAAHELDAAQAEFDALVEEAQLNLDIDRLRAENATRQAEAALNAADQRLHILGLDHATVAALPTKKENGDFARLDIRAPRAGTITAQSMTVGKFVKPEDSLCTIADLSNVWVWCDVYERDLATLHAKLAEGKPLHACVRVAAFGDTPFCGEIDLVGSALDEHTRTVKARVQVTNESGKLKPGMFATVDIELASGKRAAFVPREAVLADEGKAFVFQRLSNDLWLRRDVVVGAAQGGDVAIVSGLEPEAVVASGGGFMLKSDVLRNKMGAG